MIQLPLLPQPNQTFTTVLDSIFFTITIKYLYGVMGITINAAGSDIITNQSIVIGTPIIDYVYLQAGNFFFLTANEDVADYTKFGASQILIYASQAEMDAIRATIS